MSKSSDTTSVDRASGSRRFGTSESTTRTSGISRTGRRANGRDETVAERHAGEYMEPHRGGPATTAAFFVRFALPAVGATVEPAVDDDTIVAVRDLTIVRRMRLAPLRRRAVRTRVVANDAHLFSAYALSSDGEVVPAPPRAGLVRFGRD
jgi:hypothetical protein